MKRPFQSAPVSAPSETPPAAAPAVSGFEPLYSALCGEAIVAHCPQSLVQSFVHAFVLLIESRFSGVQSELISCLYLRVCLFVRCLVA